MIVSLEIQNFGIIQSQKLFFSPGLNIISGESGTGKSLVMNALDIILGSRLSARHLATFVRTGEAKAVLEANFYLQKPAELIRKLPILEEYIHPEAHEKAGHEATTISICKEIEKNGKSKIYCNNIASTLNKVRSIACHLAELHGQHEQQRILDIATHISYLDHFAQTQTETQAIQELYQKYQQTYQELVRLNKELEDKEESKDQLRLILSEIDLFAPKAGEWENLTRERELIRNKDFLHQSIYQVYNGLREAEGSILSALQKNIEILEPHKNLLPGLEERLGQLGEARYIIEEIADFLREQKNNMDSSPAHLEAIQERISGYKKLFKKYTKNGDYTELELLQRKCQKKLEEIQGGYESIQDTIRQLENYHGILSQKSEELSQKRKAKIPELEALLSKELGSLGMQGACIQIQLSQQSRKKATPAMTEAFKTLKQALEKLQEKSESRKPQLDRKEARGLYLGDLENMKEAKSAYAMLYEKHIAPLKKLHSEASNACIHERGLDYLEFLLISNPGEAAQPLNRIASGGELSRISLAFKSIFFATIQSDKAHMTSNTVPKSDLSKVQSIIFDEVDTGVGGEAAHAIAKRLQSLASLAQVLAVTHLPQIARLADRHFYTTKALFEERICVQIKALNDEERLHELTRMLGGTSSGDAVIEHARELLQKSTE